MKTDQRPIDTVTSRRTAIVGSLGVAAAAVATTLPSVSSAAAPAGRGVTMDSGFVTVKDGSQIFYKDWGCNAGARTWDEVRHLLARLDHAELNLPLCADAFVEKCLHPLDLGGAVGLLVRPCLPPG